MSTTPCVSKLNVYRRLSDGRQVVVGQLAQNSKGVFFQYDAGYLAHYHSLSPFKMPFDSELCKAPKTPQVDPEGPGPRR
jgi:serine/threonine-protein kinase HipA